MSDATKPRLKWAQPGHESEYLVNIPGYGLSEGVFIPQQINQQIADALPDFYVENRGTRIEITKRQPYGTPDHETVLAAVTSILGDVTFEDAERR